MKKFLCILLVTALLFAFAACGGSDTSGENEIKVVVSTEGSGNIAFAYEGEEIDHGGGSHSDDSGNGL